MNKIISLISVYSYVEGMKNLDPLSVTGFRWSGAQYGCCHIHFMAPLVCQCTQVLPRQPSAALQQRRTTLHLAFGYLAFYIVRSMPTPYGFFPYPCFATYDQHLGALEGGWYYKTFTRILQTPNMRSFTVYIKAHCQMGINQTHPTHKMYPRGPKLARSSRTLADLP